MKINNDVIIRPIAGDHEKKKIKEIMKRSYSLVMSWFFSFSPNVFVAEKNSKILGAIVLKFYKISKNNRGGFLSDLFVDPDSRCLGIGQMLVDAGIKFFEEKGCDEISGCVEGFNTSSFKRLNKYGFSILSPGQQIKRYKLRFLSIWFKTNHYLDVGHFFWVKPSPKKTSNSISQWITTIILNSFIIFLGMGIISFLSNFFPLFRFMSLAPSFEILHFIVVPIILIALFGIRVVIMKIGMKSKGVSTRFRMWESGFPLSFILALSGSFYPILGSIYPTTKNWRYHDLKNKYGFSAFLSSIIILLIGWSLWLFSVFFQLPNEILIWFTTAEYIIISILIFDVILIFFPFVSFNGRHIWNWNHYIWGIIAMFTIFTIIVFLIT